MICFPGGSVVKANSGDSGLISRFNPWLRVYGVEKESVMT